MSTEKRQLDLVTWGSSVNLTAEFGRDDGSESLMGDSVRGEGERDSEGYSQLLGGSLVAKESREMDQ